jgi:NADPH:quinone reductase
MVALRPHELLEDRKCPDTEEIATRRGLTATFRPTGRLGRRRSTNGSVQMRAVCVDKNEAGTALVVRDVAEPTLGGPHDILVGVRASALNRADLRRAAAHFVGSQGVVGPAIGGLEMAGEVLEVGPDVHGLTVGDSVMAMTGGAWAERVVLDHRLAVPVPDSFDWIQAAATPISFITAFDALADAAGLRSGQSVLVQGGSSAAGIAVVQLAAVMGAGPVIATSTTSWKVEALRRLGCEAVDASSDDVLAVVAKLTDGRGVDVVVDIVGQGVVQQNIDAACVQGRIVCLGRLAGTDGSFNLDEFARKRIHMVGVTFRTRSMQERFGVVERFRARVLPLLGRDEVRPVVDRTFPLNRVEEAEDYMKSGQGFGKVVIDLAAD